MSQAVLVAILLGSQCQLATASRQKSESAVSSAVSSFKKSAYGFMREVYTTNAICTKKHCINPVFPGMEDMHRLQQSNWMSSTLSKTSSHMGFCRNAITYDPALPVPAGSGASLKSLVERQDNAASTMFYYHLDGLGLEAWDYQKPEFANDCIKSVWRMVCFTYFPRAEVGVQDGAFSKYIRPCQSSCHNYIRQCGVECCDESVQCVFQHSKAISKTQTVTTEGYIPHDGPSSLCTGAARRSAPLGAIFWVVVAIIMAMSLQGCDYDVPVHNVGNWRGQPDYLIKHEFIAPGASAKEANLNSCSLTTLSQTLQCSGHGTCKMWQPHNIENTLAFCECDRDWADPECRTRRKSQAVTFFLSLFGGLFGADQFYMGFFSAGLMKLFTLGGFGVWWITDLVAIGSGPVYANHYRLAADFPHYLFVLCTTMAGVFVGFGIAYIVIANFRHKRFKEAMLLRIDEDKRQRKSMKIPDDEPENYYADPYMQGPDFPVNLGPQQMYGSMGAMPPTMGMMPQSGFGY